jgi:hypothetical protein
MGEKIMKSLRFLFCHNSFDEEHELVNYILDRGKEATPETIEAVAETGYFNYSELVEWDVKVLETKRFVGVIFENKEYIFKKPKKNK